MGRGRHETIQDEVGVSHLIVEVIYVVCDDDVGAAVHLMEPLDELLVVLAILLVALKIWECQAVDFFLVEPLPREGDNLPLLYELDNILVPLAPAEADVGRRLNVEQKHLRGTRLAGMKLRHSNYLS